MWTCPVCNQSNDTLLCTGCGFDGSCDLEHYPTLAVPVQLPESIRQRKQLRQLENEKLLHCPQCGKDQFRFHLEDGVFLCAQCSHRLPLEQLPLSKFQPSVIKEEPVTPAEEPPMPKAEAVPVPQIEEPPAPQVEVPSAPIAEQTPPPVQENNAITLCNQGSIYYHADQNYDLAADHFRQAAQMGNAAAQHSLGYCYQYGRGVERNLSKAVEYYRLAANQGYSPAQFNLGFCCYFGYGVAKDYFQAAEYFREAANQGNVSAQIWLAGCYYHGRGVPQSYTKAAEYYRLAANQGSAHGHKYLGDCYQYGHGVPQDTTLAAKHFSKILI